MEVHVNCARPATGMCGSPTNHTGPRHLGRSTLICTLTSLSTHFLDRYATTPPIACSLPTQLLYICLMNVAGVQVTPRLFSMT